MIDYTKPWKSLSAEEKDILSRKHGIEDEAAWDGAVAAYTQEALKGMGNQKSGQSIAFKDYLDQKAAAQNAGVATYDLGTLGNTISKAAQSAEMVDRGNRRFDELAKTEPSFESLRSNPVLAQQLQKFALRQEQGSPLFVGKALAGNVRDLEQNQRNTQSYYGGQSGIAGAMNQTAVLNKNMADQQALLTNEELKNQASQELGQLIGQQQRERETQSHQNYARYNQDMENYRNKLSGAQNLVQTGKANLMDIGEALPYQTANMVQHGLPMFSKKPSTVTEAKQERPIFINKYKFATPSGEVQDTEEVVPKGDNSPVDLINGKPMLLSRAKKRSYDPKYKPMFVS